MKRNPDFDLLFTEEAHQFLSSLDRKVVEKIIKNAELARFAKDPKLFKKLTPEIWELRTRFNKQQYRLLAFWDKEETNTLVIATHGFIKKTQKVPSREIKKCEQIRIEYFKNKANKRD